MSNNQKRAELKPIPNCVIVFIRAPELGKVKTRLQKRLDAETVLHLYENFVKDIIKTLSSSNYPIKIFFHPHYTEKKMSNWFGDSFSLYPQKGNDLGEKMSNAFHAMFSKGAHNAILIGTDCPDLDGSVFEEAFESLKHNPVVIGPAFDGGYYLIGFNSDAFDETIFQGISWGTKEVFEKTMIKCREKFQKVHLLPKWNDIDTFEDLIKFMKNKSTVTDSSHTYRYLSRLVEFRQFFR